MREYLGKWEFWVAVIAVVLVTHYLLSFILGLGKGKAA